MKTSAPEALKALEEYGRRYSVIYFPDLEPSGLTAAGQIDGKAWFIEGDKPRLIPEDLEATITATGIEYRDGETLVHYVTSLDLAFDIKNPGQVMRAIDDYREAYPTQEALMKWVRLALGDQL